MTTVVEAVAGALVGAGVRHVFGLVGGGNVLAVAAMTSAGLHYTAARHESGAVVMADAYHRVGGGVAVCTTTHGAGLTNALTPLAEAVKHRSGLVLVSGAPATGGPGAHDVDQVALLTSLGVEVEVLSPDGAEARTRAAVVRARAERRPVALLLPTDVSGAEVGVSPEAGSEPLGAAPPVTPDADRVMRIAAALATARRPLVVAGLGAWRAGAREVLEELGTRVGAFLATTVMGSGMFAGSPWSVGVCGGFSAPATARLIAEADVVVAFGASLDPFTLHGGRLIDPRATVVQVTLADTASSRADTVLRADAAATARALLAALGPATPGEPADHWRSRIGPDRLRALARGWHAEPFQDRSEPRRIDPRSLTRALVALLPRERTVVWDGGHFIAWPAQYWSVPDPHGLVFTGAAFQCIGLGFAGAVGAAVGRPDRVVVLATGDGGGLMGLPELETLVRTGVSALVVIYDDASYGFEEHMYLPRGADPATVRFSDTDFAGIARALGAEAVTVRAPEDLAIVERWTGHGRPGVLVLDCKLTGGVVAPFLEELIRGPAG
ncbi:thiamine pyrophosphate-binding protein [Streptomyces sp. ST2-7A]|uniref:thiamine pyrophosphate-binding protein n=1 Tax=Streptomyces sp. ST2-7A TaxID=2907214 RepID=UPI001F23BE16|nr:thiamine pyrophosphate-binding protein [Streptomyces sp. ST2-7A]MCE7079476.1 thiamine pyrophosphate-binding protein [Streptomyces sp. ST2-7A]